VDDSVSTAAGAARLSANASSAATRECGRSAGRTSEIVSTCPALRVGRLAAQLHVGERHLSRSFRAMFGASPKQFARIARIQKILAMRQGGSAWADIAYACGFADQAHMINEFDAIVGEPPQQLFRRTALDREGRTTIGPDFFEHGP
jgi:AraC-like DNA-binding protein